MGRCCCHTAAGPLPAAQQQDVLALPRQAEREVEEQGGLAAALRPAQQAVAGVWRQGRERAQLAMQLGVRRRQAQEVGQVHRLAHGEGTQQHRGHSSRRFATELGVA